jgi:hypothetical protein
MIEMDIACLKCGIDSSSIDFIMMGIGMGMGMAIAKKCFSLDISTNYDCPCLRWR